MRQRLFAVAARLLHVLGAGEACPSAELGELQGLGLTREVSTGDLEAALERPDLNVISCHFGDERHLGIVEARRRRFLIGLGRLDAPTRAPKHVQLPARIEAGTELVARDRRCATAGGTARAGPALDSERLTEPDASTVGIRAAPAIARRGPRFTQLGARLAQVKALSCASSTNCDSTGSPKPRHHWLRSPRALPLATGVLVASSPLHFSGVLGSGLW